MSASAFYLLKEDTNLYITAMHTAESFAELLYKGAVTDPYGSFNDIAKTGEMSWYGTRLTDETIRLACNYIGQLVTATPDERENLEGEGLTKISEQVVGGKYNEEYMAGLILAIISDLSRAVKTGGAFFVIDYFIKNEHSSKIPEYSDTTLMSAIIDIIKIEQSKVELRKDTNEYTRKVFDMVKRGEELSKVKSLFFEGNSHPLMNLLQNVPIVVEEIKVAVSDASAKQGCGIDINAVINKAFKFSFYDEFYSSTLVGRFNTDVEIVKKKLSPDIEYIVDMIKFIV